MEIILQVCIKYVPVRKSSMKKACPKIPRDRKILMRKRRKINEQLQSASSKQRKEKLERKLINIEISLQLSHKATSTRKEQKALKAIKTNPKHFFAYAKKYSKTNSSIGPLLDKNNEYTSSAQKMANILADQYNSVFSKPIGTSKYSDMNTDARNPITDIVFTENDIIDVIDELSNTSSSGPDGVPALLLKKCKSCISQPLYLWWRECIDQGVTPSDLKNAHIIPIQEGGHQGVASNYRPIALTSHIIKIFEKVLRKNIV